MSTNQYITKREPLKGDDTSEEIKSQEMLLDMGPSIPVPMACCDW